MKNSTLTALSACILAIAPGCERLDTASGAEGVKVDSLTTVVLPRLSGGSFIRADVFLYDDSGPRLLEGHVRLTGSGDSAIFRTPSGDKTAVVIANSPWTFDDKALSSFDSMEILPFHYCDEGTVRRMMSGSLSCRAGDTVEVAASSYMCSVSLRSVEHSFSSYKRLEDPIVRLENVSSGAEALRRDSFQPSQTTSDTTGMRGLMWDTLPSDVGMYPQYPDITLMCYPNESSVSRSRIVVEGVVDGKRRSFVADLPTLAAGKSLRADLTISSTPDSYSFSIY